MFGKKKRREDVEEYEEFSPEEGYEPFFPENEDAEAEYEPACKGLVESLAALKGKPVELENLPQLSV